MNNKTMSSCSTLFTVLGIVFLVFTEQNYICGALAVMCLIIAAGYNSLVESTEYRDRMNNDNYEGTGND